MPKTHESLLLRQDITPSEGYKPIVISTMIKRGYTFNRKSPVGTSSSKRDKIATIKAATSAPDSSVTTVNLAADGHTPIYFFIDPDDSTTMLFYPAYDVIKVEDDDLDSMFSAFQGLTIFSDFLSRIDSSKTYSCKYMFEYCYGLESADLGGLNVGTAYRMFQGCEKLTSITNIDTTECRNMAYMFYGCTALTTVSLTTANCTGMQYMFAYTAVSKVSGFDTSNCESFYSMYYENTATSIVCSSFDASNVKDFGQMFLYATAKKIYLGNFDTSSGTHFEDMFGGSGNNLKTIYCKKDFVTTNQYDTSERVFNVCTSLVGGNGTEAWNADETSAMAKIDKSGQTGYFTTY